MRETGFSSRLCRGGGTWSGTCRDACAFSAPLGGGRWAEAAGRLPGTRRVIQAPVGSNHVRNEEENVCFIFLPRVWLKKKRLLLEWSFLFLMMNTEWINSICTRLQFNSATAQRPNRRKANLGFLRRSRFLFLGSDAGDLTAYPTAWARCLLNHHTEDFISSLIPVLSSFQTDISQR